MRFKTVIAAAVLATMPALALAEGCRGSHSDSANSCALGEVWDTASQSCVKLNTS